MLRHNAQIHGANRIFCKKSFEAFDTTDAGFSLNKPRARANFDWLAACGSPVPGLARDLQGQVHSFPPRSRINRKD